MDVNIDVGRAFLVIVLTIAGVILINLVIYASVKGKGNIRQIDMMRKAVGQARNPWENEDKSLTELSKMVADLKQKPEQSNTEETQSQDGRADG